MPDPQPPHLNTTKTCRRCRGRAIYWRTAIVPGDRLAPTSSNRAFAHPQPAWVCLDCGDLEPHDRRAHPSTEHPIWRP
jgi:hypothetical protein